MKITLVTPAPPDSLSGNRVTAERWADRLRELGHELLVEEDWGGGDCDALVALHARKSYASIRKFRAERATAPLLVALTGTDVYGDLGRSPQVDEALELATTILALQPSVTRALAEHLRSKLRVIHQSASAPQDAGVPDPEFFDACLLSHLREVKAPLLAARAARLLPESSRIRILHAGAAFDPELAEQARTEMQENPRYHWLGPLPRQEALQLLARSRALLLTSRTEGGANVVSEAIACGVPILSSRMDGSLGILGPDHPGYFPVGDEVALARLLERLETDGSLEAELRDRSRALLPLVDPATEREAWRTLLAEFA